MAVQMSKRTKARNQNRLLKAHQTAHRQNPTLSDASESIESSMSASSAFSENLQSTIGQQVSREDLELLLQSQGINLEEIPPEMQELVLSQLQSQFQSQSQSPDTGSSSATSPEDEEVKLTGKYLKLKVELQQSVAGTFFPIYSMAKAANAQSVIAADCKVMLQHAGPLSDRLARLSKAYPRIYEILNKTSKIMPILAVAGELYAIGAAIAANHGINVPGFPG